MRLNSFIYLSQKVGFGYNQESNYKLPTNNMIKAFKFLKLKRSSKFSKFKTFDYRIKDNLS